MSQADWDRLQYYSRKVKAFRAGYGYDSRVHPSALVRIAQLQPSGLFPSLRHLSYTLTLISISHIFLFLSPLLDSLELDNIRDLGNTFVGPFLATLSCSPQMLRRIVLSSGRMSVDTLKRSTVNFKHLRSLELLDAVLLRDFSLWEVLGTLPSLENLTLVDNDPASASHPRHDPENSNSQCGGLKYFDALESLEVTGSIFLIQHLLGLINSPCFKSIEVTVFEDEPEDLLTPSMTIVASKWSQSLNNLAIFLRQNTNVNGITHQNSTLFRDLQEMQTFRLAGGRMENNNDAARYLAMSWPRLQILDLYSSHPPTQMFISISTLRIIAENCLDLRCLDIQLDISTIPLFDDISIKKLRHNLETLEIQDVLGPDSSPQKMLEYQIDVARHLDLIFPYLKTIEVRDEKWLGICNLVKLYQNARGQ